MDRAIEFRLNSNINALDKLRKGHVESRPDIAAPATLKTTDVIARFSGITQELLATGTPSSRTNLIVILQNSKILPDPETDDDVLVTNAAVCADLVISAGLLQGYESCLPAALRDRAKLAASFFTDIHRTMDSYYKSVEMKDIQTFADVKPILIACTTQVKKMAFDYLARSGFVGSIPVDQNPEEQSVDMLFVLFSFPRLMHFEFVAGYDRTYNCHAHTFLNIRYDSLEEEKKFLIIEHAKFTHLIEMGLLAKSDDTECCENKICVFCRAKGDGTFEITHSAPETSNGTGIYSHKFAGGVLLRCAVQELTEEGAYGDSKSVSYYRIVNRENLRRALEERS